jgi:hypothetical protein
LEHHCRRAGITVSPGLVPRRAAAIAGAPVAANPHPKAAEAEAAWRSSPPLQLSLSVRHSPNNARSSTYRRAEEPRR